MSRREDAHAGTFDKDVLAVSSRLFRQLDTPRSLTCEILARYGEWDQLVALRCDPDNYTIWDTEKLRRDYQATELLRKCDGLPLKEVDPLQACVSAFYESERQCHRTNTFINGLTTDKLPPAAADRDNRGEATLLSVLSRARSWLRKMLGRCPSIGELDVGHGPGATFESKGWRKPWHHATVYDKYANSPASTVGALPHLVEWSEYATVVDDLWNLYGNIDLAHLVVQGNRFFWVHKDATTHRGACAEPTGNVFLQLGFGRYMRRRLALSGINLERGKELHMRLAAELSRRGEGATIDLSKASDTVATSLVRYLLPPDWFATLDDIRSKFTLMPWDEDGAKYPPYTHVSWTSDGTPVKGPVQQGRWIRLEKFSSMGNGFTFELETAIFASLAHACGGTVGCDTFVYGDDIIVEDESVAHRLLRLLSLTGFTPNERKTFINSHFRESCGGDFHHGAWVRPMYIKEVPNDPAGWISMANAMWRTAKLNHSMDVFHTPRLRVLDCVPVEIRRCRGPEVLGDLLIHDHPDHWSCVVRRSRRYFRVWRPVSHRIGVNRYGVEIRLITNLTGFTPSRWIRGVPLHDVVPRDGVVGFRFGRVAYS